MPSGAAATFLSYASTRSSREREALAFVLQLLRFSTLNKMPFTGGKCGSPEHVPIDMGIQRWLTSGFGFRKLFPPVVSGTCVTLIGAGLIGSGIKYWGGGTSVPREEGVTGRREGGEEERRCPLLLVANIAPSSKARSYC